MSLKTFIIQCRKRKIFKGFSIYAISSWIIIQVAATTFPYLGVPKQAVTFIIILVLVGLPISLIFSWYYNVVADELDDVKDVPALSDNEASRIFKAIIIGIAIIVIGIVILLINRNFKSEIERVNSNRIAVLDFKNATGNPEFDLLGKIIADWIEYGIIENELATVVSSEVINNYTGVVKSTEELPSSSRVLNNLSVEKTITGGIYKNGDFLIAKCSVYQWPDREASFAFEDIRIVPNNPNEGINNLKNKVLGYLHSSRKKALQLQDNPPNYAAYELVLKAGDLINDLDPKALELLDQALEIDSTYFEAKVLKLSYYYSIGEFEKADSLRVNIVPDSRSNTRQLNLLNFYNALLNGKNKAIYNTWKKEYEYAPFDLSSNQNMMIFAQQYVYKPLEIEAIYEAIDMKDMDFNVCLACIFRKFLLATSYIEQEKYRKTIALIEPHLVVGIDPILLGPLITAYVRLNHMGKLRDLFRDLPNLLINEDLTNLYLKAIKQLLIIKNEKVANEFIEIVKVKLDNEESYRKVRVMIMEKSYQEAEILLEKLYANNKLELRGKSNLAISYYMNGRPGKGDSIVLEIQKEEGKYDFGNVKYNLALIEAYRENEDKVLEYLRESVSKGYIYGPEEFHNESAFQKYKDSQAFKSLLTYWH